MLLNFFKNIGFWNLEEEELLEDDKFEYYQNLINILFLYTRTIKLDKKNIFISFNNNVLIFSSFLKIRYNLNSTVTFLIGNFEKGKFSWTSFNYIPYKLFNRVKPIFCINSLMKLNINTSQKSKYLKNLIVFKKKVSLLKRKDKLKNFLLLRTNVLRNYKLFNAFTSTNKNMLVTKNSPLFNTVMKKKKSFSNYEVSKILELKKRWYKFFSTNRNVLKRFLNIEKNKQFQITKTFSKKIKATSLTNLLQFEFSLFNCLLRSRIVFTLEESKFLINNSFVFVNGVLVTNPNYFLKLGDVINIRFSKKYFYFYKTNFNSKLKLTHAVGYRLWRLNRFKNNFYKQSPIGIPDWIFKLSFFFEDVPSFLEVDYISLSFGLIKYPINYYDYNYYFNKFISFYLMRLYNWKYVI